MYTFTYTYLHIAKHLPINKQKNTKNRHAMTI